MGKVTIEEYRAREDRLEDFWDRFWDRLNPGIKVWHILAGFAVVVAGFAVLSATAGFSVLAESQGSAAGLFVFAAFEGLTSAWLGYLAWKFWWTGFSETNAELNEWLKERRKKRRAERNRR